MEQIALLSEKINSLVNEAEQMGIQGNVEQAQGLMKLCDQLKEERENLRKQNDNSHWSQVIYIYYSIQIISLNNFFFVFYDLRAVLNVMRITDYVCVCNSY